MRIAAGVLAGLWMMSGSVGARQGGPAGEAQVTFYGAGSAWKTGLQGSRDAPFSGVIFEQEKLMMHLSWNHFLTLRFEPGVHTFSASLREGHAAKNSQLSMNLEAGKHYFVKASDHNGIDFARVTKGLLEVVPCDVAQKEAGRMRPLQARYMVDERLPQAVEGETLPGCP